MTATLTYPAVALAEDDACYDWGTTDSEGRWRLRDIAAKMTPTTCYAESYADTILLLAGDE